MIGLPRRLAIVGLGLLPFASLRAQSSYPDRPITLIAPFSPGGAADLAARALAQHAGRHLPGRPRGGGMAITVENRPGASGAIGTLQASRARPDGHTLLLARVGSAAVLPALDARTPYAWDDFTMLGLLDENPYVICVRADALWQDIASLLTALREQPGKLTFATSGPATILDLGIRQMFAAAGLAIDAGVALPFRGGGEAIGAVLNGQAQFIGNNLSDMSSAIAAGQLRPLVVNTPQRLPGLRDLPTMAEAGLQNMAPVIGWDALFGPPSLAAEVVQAWTAALAALAKDDAWLAATRRMGSIPRVLPPAETKAYVESQVALYRDMGKRLGLI